ncbi:sporulation membrane protein YtrI [Bacillus sp. FJAT-45350]|uniref:sporulation membrane protein YtrI n=1 Tax=Bacillus sp. FJAT-45350 TaxID=2011014 RepID=UPI000BB83778|nr:sporulation membrane protein YtrI [Bacillus sp. FJAT-45350]
MRIPEYYKRPGWQRFFAGVIIGMLIGWGFFIYNFGTIHERLVIEIKKQQLTIDDQKKTIKILRSDQEKLNEENQKKLTIQDIEIQFTNEEKLKLNELTLYELKQNALSELEFLKGKDIETVSRTKDLMIRTIENKMFTIGESRFQLKTVYVSLYTTIELHMKIEFVN